MKYGLKLKSRIFNTILWFTILFGITSCTTKKADQPGPDIPDNFKIGWASVDITPDKPVLLHGQFHARISEGVLDPITATVLALESTKENSSGKALMVSLDLVYAHDNSRDADNLLNMVRKSVVSSIPGLKPEHIIFNGTHTHTAPYVNDVTDPKSIVGIEVDAMAPSEYKKNISKLIAGAAIKAWTNRQPGGISYGIGQAVVGHNRQTVTLDGKTVMYGSTDVPEYSGMEGNEDHSVNLLYTWDAKKNLTGIVINVPCPSQVSEQEYLISADYWHDTRVEVRKRLGKGLYILPQCSAAGDQSPHMLNGLAAEERMQRLMFTDSIDFGWGSRAHRKQIALRIADAVSSVFPYMKDNINWDPEFAHRMEIVELTRNDAQRRLAGEKDSRKVFGLNDNTTIDVYEQNYYKMLKEINDNPELKKEKRWYVELSYAYARGRVGRSGMRRGTGSPSEKYPVEVHVIRIDDMAIATNPFELYLDYALRMKSRSPAVQTFVVQLAGSGGYLPTARAFAGGSYGAASTAVGPEGGQELVEKTVQMIKSVW